MAKRLMVSAAINSCRGREGGRGGRDPVQSKNHGEKEAKGNFTGKLSPYGQTYVSFNTGSY